MARQNWNQSKNIDGYVYQFTDSGELIGIDNFNGTDVNVDTITRENPIPVDPKSKLYEDLKNSENGIKAYNIEKYGSNTDAYEDEVTVAPSEKLDQHYAVVSKVDNIDESIPKVTYPSADNGIKNPNIAPSPSNAYAAYKESRGKKAFAHYYTYPLDLDPNQDHMKITKYKYKRPSMQGSRPATSITKSELDPSFEWNKNTMGGNSTKYKQAVKDNQIKYQVNKPGDSMLGSEIDGSVFLPMPKVVDTNGAEWGESELNIFGLAATSVASKFFGDTGADKEDIKVAKNIK